MRLRLSVSRESREFCNGEKCSFCWESFPLRSQYNELGHMCFQVCNPNFPFLCCRYTCCSFLGRVFWWSLDDAQLCCFRTLERLEREGGTGEWVNMLDNLSPTHVIYVVSRVFFHFVTHIGGISPWLASGFTFGLLFHRREKRPWVEWGGMFSPPLATQTLHKRVDKRERRREKTLSPCFLLLLLPVTLSSLVKGNYASLSCFRREHC